MLSHQQQKSPLPVVYKRQQMINVLSDVSQHQKGVLKISEITHIHILVSQIIDNQALSMQQSKTMQERHQKLSSLGPQRINREVLL